MAVGARRRAGQPQWHPHTLGGLEEVQVGLGLEVLAAAGPAGPGLLCAPPEQSAEQVTDIGAAVLPGLTEQIVEVEAAGAVVVRGVPATAAAATTATAAEAPSEATAGEHPAGLVVLLALGGIQQDVLGLADLLVALLGRRVIRVAVGMVFGEQLAGDPLDLIVLGVGGDAEHLVEVFLNPFPLNHAASPPLAVRRVPHCDSAS